MNESKESMDSDLSYQVTHRYWTHQDASSPSFMGVATYGGGGLLEADYRGREEARNFKKLVSLTPQSKVLELGCGNGRWILAIAPHVSRYIGVDFSSQMLDLSRQRVSDAGLDNVELFESSLQDYNPTMPVDIIYLAGVSMYVNDTDLFESLVNLRKHLPEGGILIERSTFHRRGREVISFRPEDRYAAIYRTPEEIIEIFKKSGYRLQSNIESYAYFNFSRDIIEKLNRPHMIEALTKYHYLTYPLLRYACNFQNWRKGYFGEMQDYTHRFLSFTLN